MLWTPFSKQPHLFFIQHRACKTPSLSFSSDLPTYHGPPSANYTNKLSYPPQDLPFELLTSLQYQPKVPISVTLLFFGYSPDLGLEHALHSSWRAIPEFCFLTT
jgi:hypothetical protein